jgi:uncharacterized protein
MAVRTTLFWCMGVVSVVAVAAFGWSAEAQEKPNSLTFKTGSTGGSWYPVGAGLSRMFNDEGIRINVEEGGGNANVVNISRGEGDIGFTYTVTLVEAAQGEEPFGEEITNLRGLATLYTNVMQTVVRADAGVSSYADLKDKPFAAQTQGNASTTILDQLLQAYGLQGHDDLRVVIRGGPSHGSDALKDRRAVGFHSVTTVPNAVMSETAVLVPIKLLPVSQEALDKLMGLNAGYVPATVPAGTYEGVNEDVPSFGADLVLFAREDMPEDHAYWFVRILTENVQELGAVHVSMAGITKERLATVAGVQMHPGAERYYEEVGLKK